MWKRITRRLADPPSATPLLRAMSAFRRVLVIGLDGLDPRLVTAMMARGELPHLERLRARGGMTSLATTTPAQTPVAWSSFATGTNPGGHGIFDFIRRDPRTYLPDLSLNRYEQKNSFVPPRAVNHRRGVALWNLLSDAGVPSAVLRCPCTFPPDPIRGRMLSGMGVPDLRGGLGTSTFYTSDPTETPRESENVVHVQLGPNAIVETHVLGPRHPRTREAVAFGVRLELRPDERRARLSSEGQPRTLDLEEGRWSEWLTVKFKLGLMQSVSGIVRFLLVNQAPVLQLYASPVNFSPQAPLFPISAPAEYAGQLAQALGAFHTTGMAEDHTGLTNRRFDEAAYLEQCALVLRERERMLQHELARFDEGLLFCLFDTPDRIQHMFWRFREPEHPANKDGCPPEFARVIEDHYRECDAIVGRAVAVADPATLVIVLSDHGFSSFQRGLHLNAWLRSAGYLARREEPDSHADPAEFLSGIDWSRTKAYALGLGSLYLNLKGREAEGIVEPSKAPELVAEVSARLRGLVDPGRGRVAVRNVAARDELYSGPFASEAPDLVVKFAEGYRVSWTTALGGVPSELFEDNVKKWGGDHIVDPALVPGVLFMNQPFDDDGPQILDVAPTILHALGVPPGTEMEGRSRLST